MRRAIVLATIAALALPTAASAKEVAALTLCGSDGCQKITAHAALQGFMNGGYETLAPKRAAPFFTVKVAMRHAGDDAGGWTVEYLRAANLIRATADYSTHVWTRPAGVTARALRRAARGLRASAGLGRVGRGRPRAQSGGVTALADGQGLVSSAGGLPAVRHAHRRC